MTEYLFFVSLLGVGHRWALRAAFLRVVQHTLLWHVLIGWTHLSQIISHE